MARPLRITYEGAFYHVTARGNERKKIFLSRTDYEKFLCYLTDALHKHGVILHSYVLMPNHYHLIVETPKANLSTFMHGLNSSYTTYFNLKRRRTGHLFQGRYKAFLIDVDNYLLELSRYLHLNPVRAGITARPEGYAYSSFRAFVFPKEETMVFRDLLWDMISGERKRAPQRYREFVESSLKEKCRSPFEEVYAGVILGKSSFIKAVLKRLKDQNLRKVEISHRRALTSALSDIDEIVHFLSVHFKVRKEKVLSSYPYRGYGIYLSRKHTPCSNVEIARYFCGLSYSAVTKIGTRFREKMRGDEGLRGEIRELEERLSHVKG
jgi:putative transposase